MYTRVYYIITRTEVLPHNKTPVHEKKQVEIVLELESEDNIIPEKMKINFSH